MASIPEFTPWHVAAAEVRKHVVKIMTPDGSGTGFLVSHSSNTDFVAIATAAHVVDRAHYWEQPIRVEQTDSKTSVLLRNADRAIFVDEAQDRAAIMFIKQNLALPKVPLDLPPEAKSLKMGQEVGWLGYPAVHHHDMCFFSGRISRFVKEYKGYLIDGVAINGVSGGPVFWNGQNAITLIGVVSAYLLNRATGETLPGLALARDVNQYREFTQIFKTVDEAKAQEPPPAPPAPPQAPTESSPTAR